MLLTPTRDLLDERAILDAIAKEGPIGKSIPGLLRGLNDFVSNPDTVSVFTYQRMLETDETVGAAVELLNLSIAGRLGEYQHPSEEITEFVRAALSAMRGTLSTVLREILTAKWAGFSVSEIVYSMAVWKGQPAVGIRKVATLPPGTIAFEVDAHGEITPEGVIQFHQPLRRTVGWLLDNLRVPDQLAGIGNEPWPRRIGTFLGNFQRIPIDKVIHYPTGSPIFGNPYGRSPLRRAYKSWLVKDILLRMMVTALDRKGTPLIVGTAPNERVPMVDEDGTQVLDSDGNPRDVPASWLLARALANIHQESALVVGPEDSGYGIKSVDFGTAGEEFVGAIMFMNRLMVRSMLLPSLVLEEGLRSGSLALGKMHQQTFNSVIDSELKDVQLVVIEQLIRPLVTLNFGEPEEGFGEFAPVALSPEAQQALAEVFETLTTSGYLTPDSVIDWQHVRDRMGLPSEAEDFEPPEPDDPDDPEPRRRTSRQSDPEEMRAPAARLHLL